MSRERDLLSRVLTSELWSVQEKLQAEIKQLLSQPEQEQEPKFNFDLERMKAAIESPISDVTVDDLAKQVKQEPVAWIATGIGGGTAVGWYEKDIIKLPKGTKLYLQPQKREPLSDKEITKNTPKLIHIGERLAFHAGVRFAERHHIIGGGE